MVKCISACSLKRVLVHGSFRGVRQLGYVLKGHLFGGHLVYSGVVLESTHDLMISALPQVAEEFLVRCTLLRLSQEFDPCELPSKHCCSEIFVAHFWDLQNGSTVCSYVCVIHGLLQVLEQFVIEICNGLSPLIIGASY